MNLKETAINFLNNHTFVPSRVLWNPRSVTLWLTTRCNLNCSFCLRNMKKLENMDMERKVWKNVLKYNLKEINLCGNGETILHPDFFSIIKEAKKTGMKINFSTNGVLLNDRIISKFRKIGIDNFSVSIDGVGKTYEKMRKTPFEKIYGTMIKLSEFVTLGINYVGLKTNITEFPKVVETFNDYVKFIRFNHVQPYSKKIDKLHMHRYPDVMKKTSKEAEKKNLKNIKLKMRSELPVPEFCVEPFFAPYITMDGSVYPCCILGDHHNLNATEWYMDVPMILNPDNVGLMGNINDQNLKEIFRSKKFTNFRKTFLKYFKDSKRKKWSVEKYVKFREKHSDDHPCATCAYRFGCVC